MPVFKIERTEFHTRVWTIHALNENDARERYLEEDDDEEHSYHSGEPNVQVTEVKPKLKGRAEGK